MTEQERRLWLTNVDPRPGASMRLFCLPYAGGSSLTYASWPRLMPRSIEVCPIELPGRRARIGEQAFTSMEPLVGALADLLDSYADSPYALFGHSLGAEVCFALVHRLRAQHRPPPTHLFVSGRRAPTRPETDPPMYNLPDDELVQAIQRLGGTPAEVLSDPEALELVLPMIRADFSISDTWRAPAWPPLSCNLTAMGGTADPHVTPHDLTAWNRETMGEFSLRLFEGDHFYLRSCAPALVQAIVQGLTGRAPRGSRSLAPEVARTRVVSL